MPDLSGSPILDVAIGLSFLFFVLSIVASAVNELFAAMLGWRAKNLEHAIAGLLGEELKKALYANWRIRALFRKPDEEGSVGPSYIPAKVFAAALLDVVEAHKGDLASIGNDRVRAQLESIFHAEKTVKAQKQAVEQVFDDRMQRASGWYKRKTQYILWGIAVGVAFGLNVNSFEVGSQLWKDDALRAAIVTQAQSALAKPAAARPASGCPAGQVPDESDGAPGCKPDPGALTAVAQSIDDVKALDLPIGWAVQNRPDGSLRGWLGWLFGCLVTAAAVGLGAPFWFSALQKVADLRGTGGPPERDAASAPS